MEKKKGAFFPSSHCLKHVSDPSLSRTLNTEETVLSHEERRNSLCTSVLAQKPGFSYIFNSTHVLCLMGPGLQRFVLRASCNTVRGRLSPITGYLVALREGAWEPSCFLSWSSWVPTSDGQGYASALRGIHGRCFPLGRAL